MRDLHIRNNSAILGNINQLLEIIKLTGRRLDSITDANGE